MVVEMRGRGRMQSHTGVAGSRQIDIEDGKERGQCRTKGPMRNNCFSSSYRNNFRRWQRVASVPLNRSIHNWGQTGNLEHLNRVQFEN